MPPKTSPTQHVCLTAGDAEVYKQHWLSNDVSDDGFLLAEKVAPFLSSSNLHQKRLKVIWKLSDTSPPKGKLSETEFYTALKYIAIEQDGTLVDHTTPLDQLVPLPRIGGKEKESLLNSSGSDESVSLAPPTHPIPLHPATATTSVVDVPSQGALSLSLADGAVYRKHWTSLLPSAGVGDGDDALLPASVAAPFFSTSELPQKRLRVIWRLSAKTSPAGKLNEIDFYKALKYVAIEQETGIEVNVRIPLFFPFGNLRMLNPRRLGNPTTLPLLLRLQSTFQCMLTCAISMTSHHYIEGNNCS